MTVGGDISSIMMKVVNVLAITFIGMIIIITSIVINSNRKCVRRRGCKGE